ncbi:MAG TPA: DnaB-like helicase C-terminal domain-containing protein, partial [Arenicellales bacterium]|nr:DnaB-like helicase C-terminal domain-containing protein [Arenicellales bacterium]
MAILGDTIIDMVSSINAPAGDSDAYRLPPQSIEAEQSLLGGLMLDNTLVDEVTAIVTGDDFYRKDHAAIYRAIVALAEENQPADVITVSEWLENVGELSQVGGLAYLGSLAQNTPNTSNIAAYAKIVRERSLLRKLIGAANEIVGNAYRPEGRSPNEVLDHAEQMIFEISQTDNRRTGGFKPIRGLLKQTIDQVEYLYQTKQKVTGVATGFDDLDEMMSGLQRSDLVIVAGRPSMGKCLAFDSEIVLADGSVATIEEIHQRRDASLLTLGKDWRFSLTRPSHYVDDGVKPVFRVRTRLGREIETTGSHPFLTIEGWKPLQELSEGTRVAVPRTVPVFGDERWPEARVKLLAYFIGDGCVTGSTPRFFNGNEHVQYDFLRAVDQFGGLAANSTADSDETRTPGWRVVADRSRDESFRAQFAGKLRSAVEMLGVNGRQLAAATGASPAAVSHWMNGKSLPNGMLFDSVAGFLGIAPENLIPPTTTLAGRLNPLAQWFQDLGILGRTAGCKEIPASVFRLERRQLALFINRLFAADGWATVLESGQAQLGFASASERLARQIQHLLLRFGVIAALRKRQVRYKDGTRTSWQLDITHQDSIVAFKERIGMFSKERQLEDAARTAASKARRCNQDLIPREGWELVARAKGERSWADLSRLLGHGRGANLHVGTRSLTRRRLLQFAEALDSSGLHELAASDVYWDEIVAIEPAGRKQVYDLTIDSTHNFVANDVCVHNTALAMNFVEHAAIDLNLPVAIFSMEMPGSQLSMRLLASLSRVNAQRLRTGHLHDDDWPRLTSTLGMLAEKPIFIDDSPALSPLELRSRARRLTREHGKLGLI